MNDKLRKYAHVDCLWHEEYLKSMQGVVIVGTADTIDLDLLRVLESTKWSVAITLVGIDMVVGSAGKIHPELLIALESMKWSLDIALVDIDMVDKIMLSQTSPNDTMLLEYFDRKPLDVSLFYMSWEKKNKPYYRQGDTWDTWMHEKKAKSFGRIGKKSR